MVNPGLMTMLAKARQQDLSRQLDRHHARWANGGDEVRPLRPAPAARDRKVLFVKARELVRLAETLECDRAELIRLISCVS